MPPFIALVVIFFMRIQLFILCVQRGSSKHVSDWFPSSVLEIITIIIVCAFHFKGDFKARNLNFTLPDSKFGHLVVLVRNMPFVYSFWAESITRHEISDDRVNWVESLRVLLFIRVLSTLLVDGHQELRIGFICIDPIVQLFCLEELVAT